MTITGALASVIVYGLTEVVAVDDAPHQFYRQKSIVHNADSMPLVPVLV
jgi:hypothetical protein